MTDLARKYKTYRLLNPFRNEVYTAEPCNVEYILKTNFDNYGKVYLYFIKWLIYWLNLHFSCIDWYF
jgi:hypothetical protein